MKISEILRGEDINPDHLFSSNPTEHIKFFKDENNIYTSTQISGPTVKIVSVIRYYSYLSSAPKTIYYDQNGYFGYIAKVNTYKAPNSLLWEVTYSGGVIRKGPDVN